MLDQLRDLLGATHIGAGTMLVRMCLGLVLGVCVGAERQIHRHNAGLRTFTLICLGSTGAVIISIWIPQIYPEFLNGDPGRIAAQILSGVGFLGAGAIVRNKGSVQGLTSAACIWQTAIIGMAAGAGLYLGATVMTAMTLFVLTVVDHWERHAHIDGDNMLLSVGVGDPRPDVERLLHLIHATGAKANVTSLNADLREQHATVGFKITLTSAVTTTDVLDALRGEPNVTSVSIMA